MANLFTANEIVELGVQIEKNGYAFYAAVAKLKQDEKPRSIFTYLAEQEQEHVRAFEGILKNLEEADEPETYPGEYAAYLKALAEEHVFTKPNNGATIAKSVKTPLEAIKLAIGFEKDSILFYYEMKNIVSENSRPTIDELIEQEQTHLRQLTAIKSQIQ
jgi:rubrerythrin